MSLWIMSTPVSVPEQKTQNEQKEQASISFEKEKYIDRTTKKTKLFCSCSKHTVLD